MDLIGAGGVVIHDEGGNAGGARREALNCDAEGACFDVASVDGEFHGWVHHSGLLAFFVEEEGEGTGSVRERSRRELVDY